MGLHLQLEHVVFFDFIATEVGERGVLNYNTRGHILQYVIVAYQGRRVLFRQDAARVVVHDQVVLQDALGVDEDYAVEVIVDGVLLDHQLFLALNDEYALALAVFDLVVLDACLPRVLSADRDIRFDVCVDLVGDDVGVAAFDDEDALVVVVADYVGVGEALEAESAVDVVFEVLHGHLVPEILVVELG